MPSRKRGKKEDDARPAIFKERQREREREREATSRLEVEKRRRQEERRVEQQPEVVAEEESGAEERRGFQKVDARAVTRGVGGSRKGRWAQKVGAWMSERREKAAVEAVRLLERDESVERNATAAAAAAAAAIAAATAVGTT